MKMKKIKIQGEIGWDVTAQEVETDLLNANGDIEVEIDSPGGSVFEGVKIFNLLRNYKGGKVTIIINSIAASMGSYIAMAGDKIKVYDNSTFMIHNPWTIEVGDYRDFEKTAETLKGLTKLLRNKYVEKTGKSEDEIKYLMNEESWFFGEEIVKVGFANEVIKTNEDNDKQALIALAKERFKSCVRKMKEAEEDKVKKEVAALAKIVSEAQSQIGEEEVKRKIEYEVAKAKLNLLKRSLNG